MHITVVIELPEFVSLLHIVRFLLQVFRLRLLSESMERPRKRNRTVEFFLNETEQTSSPAGNGVTDVEEANERWPMYLATHYDIVTGKRKRPMIIENVHKKSLWDSEKPYKPVDEGPLIIVGLASSNMECRWSVELSRESSNLMKWIKQCGSNYDQGMPDNTLYGLALLRSWKNPFDIEGPMLDMMTDVNETFRKSRSKKTNHLVFLQHQFVKISMQLSKEILIG